MMNRTKLIYIFALVASLLAFLSVSTNSQAAETAAPSLVIAVQGESIRFYSDIG